MRALRAGWSRGVALAIAVLLSTSACDDGDGLEGSADLTTTSIAPADVGSGLAGWVGADESSVVFVMWTEDASGGLRGTLQIAAISDGAVQGISRAFSGTRSERALTLTLNAPLSFGEVLVGEIGDAGLVLYFPCSTGGLIPLALPPGGVDDFNQRVAELQVVAARAAAEQAGLEEAQRAIDAAQQDVNAARSALRSLMDGFAWDLEWTGYLLEDANSSLDALRNQVQRAREETDREWAIAEAEYAIAEWEYLLSVLDGVWEAVEDVDQDLTEIEAAIGVLEGTMTQRLEVEQQYSVDAAPLAFGGEQQLIQEARTLIRDGPAILDELRGSAATIDAEGLSLLAEARSLCSC